MPWCVGEEGGKITESVLSHGLSRIYAQTVAYFEMRVCAHVYALYLYKVIDNCDFSIHVVPSIE